MSGLLGTNGPSCRLSERRADTSVSSSPSFSAGGRDFARPRLVGGPVRVPVLDLLFQGVL